jgi:hypothetical protein
MLRDFRSALILAALTGTLYALGIYLSPLRSMVGDGAWNLLVLLGIVLSATGFVVEFVASRLSRRLRKGGTAFDDRLDAIAREKAMRLNAYLPTADCSSLRMETAAHPVRRRRSSPFRRLPNELGDGAPRVSRL